MDLSQTPEFCSDEVCQGCLGSGRTIDSAKTGQALRAKRLAAGLTLREVGKAMGLSLQHLSDMESGRRGWTTNKIERYVTICTIT